MLAIKNETFTNFVPKEMTEQYNNAVAQHYAAYRPPLHELILARTIEHDETFSIGLDIGCGTGRSTVALANYCDRVMGIDPSHSMLADAEQHPKVSYVCAAGDDLSDVQAGCVDIVSFAGSLHYAKTNQLRRQLAEVCLPGATVVVYDFEVLLENVLSDLEMDIPAVGTDYDHQANIADWSEFPALILESGQLVLDLSSEELGHVLLADSHRFEAFSRKLKSENLFERLVEILENLRHTHPLTVDIYFARYRCSPA